MKRKATKKARKETSVVPIESPIIRFAVNSFISFIPDFAIEKKKSGNPICSKSAETKEPLLLTPEKKSHAILFLRSVVLLSLLLAYASQVSLSNLLFNTAEISSPSLSFL